MRLGSQLPFAKAAAELAFFWDAAIGEETVRRHTLAAGAAAAAVEATEIEQIERELPETPAGPAVQQVSVDGAMVPLAGGDWAEVKTAAIGAVVLRPGKDGTPEAHAVALSYCSRLAEAPAFGRVLHRELHRRGTRAAPRVAAVNDGAPWIQGLLDTYCRHAVRILDFAHAAEHLASAAAAVFGADTPALHAWLDEQMSALKRQGPDPALAALRGLPLSAAVAPAAEGVRDQTLAYLEARLPQLQYPAFAAQGYPIGSGAVESAGKLVVEARLKGAGMRWSAASVTPMVTLRAARCSGRWAETWAALTEHRRHAARERRRAGFLRRHPPEPTPDQPAAPKPNMKLLRSAARKLRSPRPAPSRVANRAPHCVARRHQAS